MDFMQPDWNQFINYQALKVPQHIHGISPDSIMTDDIGSVCFFDGNKHKCTIKLILHVPKLKNGLFSLTSATLMNWHLVFENDGCMIMHHDFQFHSFIKDNLCWWKSKPQQASSAFMMVSIKLDDWHEWLGHMLRNMILNFKDKVEELLVVKDGHLGEDCESCVLGKYH